MKTKRLSVEKIVGFKKSVDVSVKSGEADIDLLQMFGEPFAVSRSSHG